MRRGLTIVQDPTEAVSPEMPRRAIKYAAPNNVLSVDAIAELLTKISSQPLSAQVLEPRMSNELDDEARQANLEDDAEKQKRGLNSVSQPKGALQDCPSPCDPIPQTSPTHLARAQL